MHPASLTHRKSSRHKVICGTRPIGCKDQLINLKMFFFVEYPVCVISVAVVKRHLFLKSLLCFTIAGVNFYFSKL